MARGSARARAAVLSARDVVARAAAAAAARKWRALDEGAVRAAWREFGAAVAATLRAGSGVLVPGLGTFSVGEVYRPSGGSQRPLAGKHATFEFSQAFKNVLQAKPALYQTGPRPVRRTNFALIAQRTTLSRTDAQRALTLCFNELSKMLLAGGRQVSVAIPSVATVKLTRKGIAKVNINAMLEDLLAPPKYASKAVDVAPPPLSERAKPPPPEINVELTADNAAEVFMDVCVDADRVGCGMVRAVDIFRAMAPGQPLQGLEELAPADNVAAALERLMTTKGLLNYTRFARVLAKALRKEPPAVAVTKRGKAIAKGEVTKVAEEGGIIADDWEVVEAGIPWVPSTRFSRPTLTREQCDAWNSAAAKARKRAYAEGEGLAPSVGSGTYARASVDFGYNSGWSTAGMPPTFVQRRWARTTEAMAAWEAEDAPLLEVEKRAEQARKSKATEAKLAYRADLDALVATRAAGVAAALGAANAWPYHVAWDAASPRPATAPGRH